MPSSGKVSALSPLESFRQDRILVKPRSELTLGNLSALHASLGMQVLQTYPRVGNLQVVAVPPTSSPSDLIATYRQSSLVEYAEPDYQVQALQAPDDFRYQDGSLWAMHNTGIYGGRPGADIHAQDAWDLQNSAGNIVVAVIDTGVRYTHEDLAANIWVNPGENPGNGIDDDGDGFVDDVHGINAINNTGDPMDDHGHGTHVSGTIGAVGNNSVGVVGVAWKVQIMACKFLDSSGNGFISDAVKCIDYARSKGAKVINSSWGSTSFSSQALRDAIDSARQAGIIWVAAAGNSAEDNGVNPIYPASYGLDNIISVAATTRADDLAFFSNYGATTVDLGAPGAAIFSCWNGSDSDYRYFDGTSMAAPHVTGACALLLAHYPNENYQQIKNRILSSVDPLPSLAGKCRTGGRLNLARALGGGAPPTLVADFTANPTSGQTPLTVQFTDTSTGSPTKRDWNFGDSAAHSSAQNPSHTYNNAGNFTATLTVTGSDGSTSSASHTITVTSGSSSLPVLTLTATQPDANVSGGQPGVVTFHRTGDTSQSYQVFWTFSGTASNGVDYQQLPTNSPFPAGQADATLTITPIDHGQVGDQTVVVTLAPGADYQIGSSNSATVIIHGHQSSGPTASFTANPTSGSAPLTVQFSDTSTGSPTNWDWNFGDGSPDGTAQNPSHTYNSAGTFTATLTVTGNGQTSSASQTITVTNAPASVTANFSANPTSGNAPLTVQFTDQSSGSITSRDWDFGDGTAHSSALNSSHTYNNAGDYTVTLMVSGSGGSNSKSLTIQVTTAPPPPPTANFGANPTSGNAPLTVQFSDQSSGSITSRDWNFGDGSAHSSALNPSHTYNSAGSYTVTLTVTGSGGSNSKSVTIQVNTPPPPLVADFTASPLLGIVPLVVNFTDRSTGNPVSWNWNFGDGSTNTARNPSHTYLLPGDYTVTLTVTGSSGATSRKSLTIHATLLGIGLGPGPLSSGP